MKKYIVIYTKDFGDTYEYREVESKSYTDAYMIVDMMLPSYAAITNISPA